MGKILDRGRIGHHAEWTLERLVMTEEGPCTVCGWPGYAGDEMILTSEGDMYCGEPCMNRHWAEEGSGNHA